MMHVVTRLVLNSTCFHPVCGLWLWSG